MKSYRQRYFDQYAYQTIQMPDGKKRCVMVYHGMLYSWSLSPIRLRTVKFIHLLMPLLSTLLLILSSVQQAQANMNRGVAILSLAALAASLAELWGGLQFTLQRKPEMTELEWSEIHALVLTGSFVHGLLLNLSTILAFIISIKTDMNLPICLGYLSAALCPILLNVLHRRIPVNVRASEGSERVASPQPSNEKQS